MGETDPSKGIKRPAAVLTALHGRRWWQLGSGLAAGTIFGFLLQKGGLTDYDVLSGQLLLADFTVARVMITAIVTGMVGIHLLRSLGLAVHHPKEGSWGAVGIGGLIFGAGFGLLGYCPGTLAGASSAPGPWMPFGGDGRESSSAPACSPFSTRAGSGRC